MKFLKINDILLVIYTLILQFHSFFHDKGSSGNRSGRLLCGRHLRMAVIC